MFGRRWTREPSEKRSPPQPVISPVLIWFFESVELITDGDLAAVGVAGDAGGLQGATPVDDGHAVGGAVESLGWGADDGVGEDGG